MYRRILALWLPTLPTDRMRRRRARSGRCGDAPPGAPPLVTIAGRQGRLALVAVDPAAAAAGLAPGMALADARALVPGLLAVEADPPADAAALAGLAEWCGRYTPWTAVRGDAASGEGGVLLDITGCAHLFGGETGLARDLAQRLAGFGCAARLAIADTAGAAWAVARTGPGYRSEADSLAAAIIAPGGVRAALAGLPVSGLRLDPATVSGLERLGLRRIGTFYDLPRGPLAARFGPLLLRRLDQALGRVAEPIAPRRPAAPHAVRLAFAEPIARTEDVAVALRHLLDRLCAGLEQAGCGARRVELALWRVDGTVERQGVGTSRPSRGPAHLFRLFAERLDRIDAGFGIEAALLTAPVVEPLGPAQIALDAAHAGAGGAALADGLADLVDRLGARLGLDAVRRLVPRESHLPERAVVAQAVAAPLPGVLWPADRPRPLRLLPWPQPVEVMAPVPDDPPVLFRWQNELHRVARADGPERLAPEWWRAAGGVIRDYYRVEDTDGIRFWMYRVGLYCPDHPPQWFLHGMFA